MMIFEKVLIFILFLGPLVFFHELGHYLFARLFGVRVEVFSIGFGPKLFKLKKGMTQYALSVIPLGGYVKMFGDDPLNRDAIPTAERAHSFTHQGKWARFWIVMGGPLANFVLAFFIFMILLMVGETVPEMRLGEIPRDSILYEKGFRSGDVVTRINSKRISSPTDIIFIDGDRVETVGIKRLEKNLHIGMKGEDLLKEFSKYPPFLRLPLVVDTDGKVYAFSTGQEVNFDLSIEEMLLADNITSLHFFEIELGEQLFPDISQVGRAYRSITFENSTSLFDNLAKEGFYPLDLVVNKIKEGSAAEKALVRPGDIITSLDGTTIHSFSQIKNMLQKTDSQTISLGVIREGKPLQLTPSPEVQGEGEEEIKLLGVYSSGKFIKPRFVDTAPLGILPSVGLALSRTWQTIVKTLEGLRNLILGDTPLKQIGGPLAIGKVASDSFETSISYFFQLMALISVNLGIINLFPIPILDGGHIMFIILEIFNRGPLSRKKMEIAQQAGLSLLLMLMVGALFNDFSRFF